MARLRPLQHLLDVLGLDAAELVRAWAWSLCEPAFGALLLVVVLVVLLAAWMGRDEG